MKTNFLTCFEESKSIFKFILVFGICLSGIETNAQLKVLSSGRVDIYNQHVISGTINSDAFDVVNYATNLSSGTDLIWGSIPSTQPNNPGLMKLATAYSTKFVVRSNGWVGICKSGPENELDIVGEGRISGNWTVNSDERLKDNISVLEGAKSSLLKLNGISYNLKYSSEDLEFEEESKSENGEMVKTKKNEMKPEFYSRKHIGFSAQDIQPIFPELVFEDSKGILSIDYIGLIPVLVEAMKEQDKNIQNLESRVLELEAINNNETKKSSSLTPSNNSTDVPVLLQNTPNPFNQKTEIGYYLPATTSNASINIYTMSGSPVKSIKIVTPGKGTIVIHGSELQPGMFLYSLLANGVEVDTKRMILTE